MLIHCPLCKSHSKKDIIPAIYNRTLYHCTQCDLVFAHPKDLLSAQEEKARYNNHENNIENAGYVAFLTQAITQATPYLQTKKQGLDFGCGPGPTLNLLLKQQGYSCDIYDQFFFSTLPNKKYDFIFATECFEHFHNPHKEIDTIYNHLAPKGVVIIMTELWEHTQQFSTWYYAADPTHVAFFNATTFTSICTTFGFTQLPSSNARIVILEKIKKPT